MCYYPGNVTLRLAGVVVINKIDSADAAGIDVVRRNIATVNPQAVVVDAASVLEMDNPAVVRGKRVLAVEDGPTLTHGEMTFGAGVVAARRFGAAALVDPEPFAVGSIRAVLEKYPKLEPLVPAMGYGADQTHELEATLNACDADLVLSATPIDITRVLTLNKPVTRVRYELKQVAGPALEDLLAPIVARARRPAGVA
jgi:predicted GTPase